MGRDQRFIVSITMSSECQDGIGDCQRKNFRFRPVEKRMLVDAVDDDLTDALIVVPEVFNLGRGYWDEAGHAGPIPRENAKRSVVRIRQSSFQKDVRGFAIPRF